MTTAVDLDELMRGHLTQRSKPKMCPFCQNIVGNPFTSNKQVIITYGINISPCLVLVPPLKSQIEKDPSLEPETTRSIENEKRNYKYLTIANRKERKKERKM